ncbi:bifunctional 3-(3-hydroxy-phenyl)propionate/3-hydroxycinnamic acid hydroxylase [Pseudotabrizicola alkalilacus]|uniref:Bifunctional 3-(3-hydroxy-phenyl)propionate/3-hydroxycinnamic acid hydroxylase n=1 Tax=Pseudotabrizicola alkalilacus TaxID=2305252 RepID=A0A411YYS1_9RHOB|nr:bifunctional 3-(3-hydroxy-phenyl)propionate/3-hydroxycinnamic acid hydroxylase [Pseudotabrizicola alkalilacus]RGP35885.1 bifunctional 3-(3-hydroxy-phenyl)propionate/3-hydroxycinnamic acid hydroxylase [Pseudotabrizicola alkalilacus]
MDYDVAIVGYGPTGMALAALLGQLGRKVIVLERYTGLYNLPRAAAFDDETMRTFQSLGVAEAMLPGTNIQKGYVWVNGQHEVLLDIEYDNPGRCGWPAQYMMYQPHLEEVMDRKVRGLPSVTVQQGAKVVGIVQADAGVTLTARAEDGSESQVTARWLVGCDGGNGYVRDHLDGALDDYGFFENWLVCDFQMRHAVPGLPSFQQVCNPEQPISIVNIGPNHHRFSFRLEAGADRDALVKPGTVWPRVAAYFGPDDAELIRVANYTFRSCVVDHWRKGRVLLAGDAAHQMPPFLAQGMVSGIRDARNLAWKLDMVLSGTPDTLLDTYQPEREPHVRFIIEKAVELGKVQTMRDPEAAKARDARMIAARKAYQKPDKLRYPALKGGLIANDGSLFPQGVVSSHTRTALFDDITGSDWLIVAKGAEALAELTDADRADWAAIGGTQAVFGLSSMVGAGDISDTGGIYTRWFDETGALAAIIRPDSHIYGTATSASALRALLNTLLAALGRR